MLQNLRQFLVAEEHSDDTLTKSYIPFSISICILEMIVVDVPLAF